MKIVFCTLIFAVFYFETINADNVVKVYRYWMSCDDKCTIEEGRELLTIANTYANVQTWEHDGYWYANECQVKDNWCTARRENVALRSEAAGCNCNKGKIIFSTADTYISR